LLVTSLQLQSQTTFPVNHAATLRDGCYAFIKVTIVKDAIQKGLIAETR